MCCNTLGDVSPDVWEVSVTLSAEKEAAEVTDEDWETDELGVFEISVEVLPDVGEEAVGL